MQQDEIEILASDPFQHDKLHRKEHVQILTQVIRNISGHCTISVDAPWGEGKTTFLRLCRQYMQNEGFPVVSFNAWETDYSDDPFIALSEELSTGLSEFRSSDLSTKLEALKKPTLEIIKHSAPAILRLATAGVIDVGPILQQDISNTLASIAEERLSAYRAMNESVVDFREKLQDIADSMADDNDGRPLVIIIDELDRCRPSYAVELLEVSKHLFAIDNVVFILAVNRSQLAHSVRALYGEGFGADEYLRRFFTIEYRLPPPEIEEFVAWLLDGGPPSTQILVEQDIMLDANAKRNSFAIFHYFFSGEHTSKRSIAQAIQQFRLIVLASNSPQILDIPTLSTALVIRTIDSGLYYRFLNSEASDLEVSNSIFKNIGREPLGNRFNSAASVFESTLIAAHREISGTIDSELYRKYDAMLNELDVSNYERQHVKSILDQTGRVDYRLGFKDAAQLIELTSRFLSP